MRTTREGGMQPPRTRDAGALGRGDAAPALPDAVTQKFCQPAPDPAACRAGCGGDGLRRPQSSKGRDGA